MVRPSADGYSEEFVAGHGATRLNQNDKAVYFGVTARSGTQSATGHLSGRQQGSHRRNLDP
jgi:hypothetical protein